MRERIAALGINDVQVQNFGSSRDVLIRMPAAKGSNSAELSASQSNCADSPNSSKQNQEVTRVYGHRLGRGGDQGRAGLNLPRGQRIFARGCFCGPL